MLTRIGTPVGICATEAKMVLLLLKLAIVEIAVLAVTVIVVDGEKALLGRPSQCKFIMSNC